MAEDAFPHSLHPWSSSPALHTFSGLICLIFFAGVRDLYLGDEISVPAQHATRSSTWSVNQKTKTYQGSSFYKLVQVKRQKRHTIRWPGFSKIDIILSCPQRRQCRIRLPPFAPQSSIYQLKISRRPSARRKYPRRDPISFSSLTWGQNARGVQKYAVKAILEVANRNEEHQQRPFPILNHDE